MYIKEMLELTFFSCPHYCSLTDKTGTVKEQEINTQTLKKGGRAINVLINSKPDVTFQLRPISLFSRRNFDLVFLFKMNTIRKPKPPFHL